MDFITVLANYPIKKTPCIIGIRTIVLWKVSCIRGGQKSQNFLATSFSELVFTAEIENRGEIG